MLGFVPCEGDDEGRGFVLPPLEVGGFTLFCLKLRPGGTFEPDLPGEVLFGTGRLEFRGIYGLHFDVYI